jgi:Family of unknown function (DUF5343)
MDNLENFAPYAAPENVLRVLARARKGGVGKIDPDFLLQIGIGDGMVARTQRALEYLGFVTDDGTLTPLMTRYIEANDEDAQAVLLSAIRDAYAVVLRAVDPAADDRTKVTNAFRTMKPSGQWGRMVTLFLGLCGAAGIEVVDPVTNRPAKGTPPKERVASTRRTPVRRTVQEILGTSSVTGIKTPGLDPALGGIVAKLGGIRSMEELERWWLAFKPTFEFVLSAKEAEATASTSRQNNGAAES